MSTMYRGCSVHRCYVASITYEDSHELLMEKIHKKSVLAYFVGFSRIRF
jgi:hypothetical protein